jgi:hypothetical protein
MKRVLREPLVQFLIVGAALYAASTFVSARDRPQGDAIVVSAGRIEHLAARFTRTWRRPPSREELEGLVDDYVRDEAAYRAGIEMGLDVDDTIIRRRIRQKLDFVASDVASLVEPTEEDLEQYLADHPNDFRIPPRYTFLQVYLDPEKRGASVEADAQELLALLRLDPAADVRDLGDVTLLGYAMEDVSPQEVSNLLGRDFASELQDLDWPAPDRPAEDRPAQPPGPWYGPIQSEYGLHLIRLDARIPGRLPGLDECTDAVRREWDNARRNEVKERFYDDLLQRYEVTIEWPDAISAGDEP